MFPRYQRFNHHTFSACYTAGKRSHLEGFSLIFQPQMSLMVAVVVPKKICPLAVKRNRWRRVVYHNIKPDLTNKKSGGYIILVKKEFIEASQEKQQLLLKELSVRIQKSGLQ